MAINKPNVLAEHKANERRCGEEKLTEQYIYGSSRLGVVNRDMNADQFKHTPDNGKSPWYCLFN